MAIQILMKTRGKKCKVTYCESLIIIDADFYKIVVNPNKIFCDGEEINKAELFEKLEVMI